MLCNAQELVLEKQTRIREYMLMMGLRQWILWTSWFIKQLIFMLIWVLAYTILFKVATNAKLMCLHSDRHCSALLHSHTYII